MIEVEARKIGSRPSVRILHVITPEKPQYYHFLNLSVEEAEELSKKLKTCLAKIKSK